MEKRKPPFSLRLRKFYKDPVISSVLAAIVLAIVTSVYLGAKNFVTEGTLSKTYTCSPSDNDIRVRKGQGVQYDTLFTLDKGQYFEVLEEGENDLVRKRTGHWRKISYNGKKGWMFSGFMVCE